MRKLGCSTTSLLGRSALENMEEIKRVGFDSTFFMFDDDIDIESYIKKANSLGLEVEALHAPFNNVNSIWLEGDEGDAYVEKIRRSIKCAAKYSIPTIVLHTSSSTDVPKTSPIGLLRHKKLIIEAERCGVKLAFENTEIIRHLTLILDYFKSENVGFCYDCGHEKCFTPGFRFMKLFGDRTFFTHIHDNFGLGQDKIVDYKTDLHRIPFDCTIDFKTVCDDIKQSGYDGSIMLEVNNRADYNFYDGLTPAEFYQKAFAAAVKLRNMLDE